MTADTPLPSDRSPMPLTPNPQGDMAGDLGHTASDSNENINAASEEDLSLEVDEKAQKLPIQPWKQLRLLLMALGVSPNVQRLRSRQAGKTPELSSRTLNHPSQSSIQITIPHGFQLQRTFMQPRPTVKNALYVSQSQVDCFATWDSHNVQVFRGPAKIVSLPVTNDRDSVKSSVSGISRWIYVKKWKVTVVATLQLELRMLGMRMELLTSVSSVKPVLSLEFNDESDELIAGGVGNIRIWTFVRNLDTSVTSYSFAGTRLVISDLRNDEWVIMTALEKKANKLFAAIDNSIYIYDYKTGHRIDSLKDAHDLVITGMTFYAPLQYLITSSRDSSIKVWTQQNHLLFNLQDQSHAPVTGLVIPCLEGKDEFPFLLSCSLDGIIRMWNLDNGTCIYRLEASPDCLGMGWMRKDMFFHYSKDRLCIWNLNRFYTTFSGVNSVATSLQRIESSTHPARIVAGAEDGSVYFLSPVTGIVLQTAFPAMKDTLAIGVEYDIENGILWSLNNDGDIAVYTVQSNPCVILEEWKRGVGHDRVTCVCAIRRNMTEIRGTIDYYNPSVGEVITLLGGTDTGQLISIDLFDRRGQHKGLHQAHAAEVRSIQYYADLMRVLTMGADGVIKLWKIEFADKDIHSEGNPDSTKPSNVRTTMSSLFTISPISNINSKFAINNATKFTVSQHARTLVTSNSNHAIIMYKLVDDGFGPKVKSHPADEDHTRTITDFASLESLGMIASASVDGTVKIWDAFENCLIRRGDLLISLPDQIALVKIQDYLPIPMLSELMSFPDGWPDDQLENPVTFDKDLDFWEFYRLKLEKDGKPVRKWHVEPYKYEGSLFDDLMERKLEELEEKRMEAILEHQRLEDEKRKALLYGKIRGLARRKTKEILVTLSQETVMQEEASKETGEVPAELEDQEIEGSRTLDQSERDALLDEYGLQLDLSEDIDDDNDYIDDFDYTQGGGTNFDEYRRKQRQGSMDSWGIGLGKAKEILRASRKAKQSETESEKERTSKDGEQEEGEEGRTKRGGTTRSRSRGRKEEGETQLKLKFIAPNIEGVKDQPYRKLKVYEQGTGTNFMLSKAVVNRPKKMAFSEDLIDPAPEKPAKSYIAPEVRTRRRNTSSSTALEPIRERRGTRIEPLDFTRTERLKSVAPPPPQKIPMAKAASRKSISERLASLGVAVPNSVVRVEVQEQQKKRRLREARERGELVAGDFGTEKDSPGSDEDKEAETSSAQTRTSTAHPLLSTLALPSHLRSRRRTSSAPAEPPVAVEEPEVILPELDDDDDEDDETAQPVIAPAEVVTTVEVPKVEPAVQIPKWLPRTDEDISETEKENFGKAPEQESGEETLPIIIFNDEKIDSQVAEAQAMDSVQGPEESAQMEEDEELTTTDDTSLEQSQDSLVANDSVASIEASQEQLSEPDTTLKASKKSSRSSIRSKATGSDSGARERGRSKSKIGLSSTSFENVANTVAESEESDPGIIFDFGSGELEAVEDMLFEPEIINTKTEEEAAHAWTLLHEVVDHEVDDDSKDSIPIIFEPEEGEENDHVGAIPVRREIRTVMNKFWFPGLNGKEVNIMNILEVLLKVMKFGFWKEKCEASKAAVYLYRTFQRDFHNALEDVILPQLEFPSDENWQYRAQQCTNMAAYNVYHPDIVFALITCLGDKVEAKDEGIDEMSAFCYSRKQARNSLATFGVDSREALLRAMMNLRMIPALTVTRAESWLDILLRRYKAQLERQIAEANEGIKQWRDEVDESIYGYIFERPASQWLTLVKPPTRPNLTDFAAADFQTESFPTQTEWTEGHNQFQKKRTYSKGDVNDDKENNTDMVQSRRGSLDVHANIAFPSRRGSLNGVVGSNLIAEFQAHSVKQDHAKLGESTIGRGKREGKGVSGSLHPGKSVMEMRSSHRNIAGSYEVNDLKLPAIQVDSRLGASHSSLTNEDFRLPNIKLASSQKQHNGLSKTGDGLKLPHLPQKSS
ncbi:WD repeat-containing protein 87 [Blyttiomyces sp. JEL0837]|nr:WD repeat-containing protein 87 [Blyttiomyces sp. JEL0837]